MRKDVSLVRMYILFALVAIMVTTLALIILFATVHSNEVFASIALIVILPFGLISKWGSHLPDYLFWIFFILAQVVYLTCIYFFVRSLLKILVNKQ